MDAICSTYRVNLSVSDVSHLSEGRCAVSSLAPIEGFNIVDRKDYLGVTNGWFNADAIIGSNATQNDVYFDENKSENTQTKTEHKNNINDSKKSTSASRMLEEIPLKLMQRSNKVGAV